ncbi:NADPH-dependent FMN reductase [Xenorhabdus thailandensis]|uniref:NADPH-dependent FMN reductase n=1 Tax=Xenorhabdus thailandensis TaxID=3136255 RepID=UPI0030F42414
MNVLFINGSLNKSSNTKALINYFSSLFDESNHIFYWSFEDTPLPFMDPEYYGCEIEQQPNKNVRQFITAINTSDIVIFASPTYHGTVSGVLKNAFDHLEKGIFAGKAIIVASVAGGIRSSTPTCDALRSIIRALGENCLIEHISAGGSDFSQKAEVIELVSQNVQERCRSAIRELFGQK